MATSMVEVKTDQLTGILEHLHPLIAKRRIRELDTDPKVLRAMPFNGDHVSALREALEDIASGGKVDIKNLTSRLMSRSWPDEAFVILQSVLEAAAPITDDELRNLAEYFAGSKRDEKKLLKIIEGMIKHSNTKDLRMSQFAKIRREALYFHMIANNPAGYQPAYHDSDVLNLAKRCESHFARYAVSLIKAQPKPSPQLKQVIRYMENGSGKMDSDYITELYTLIRPLDAKDATTLFKAVDGVCTRLHSLPRQIARNYLMALKRGGWGYAKGAKSEVAAAIYRAVDKATVQPILEDLNRPCGSNFTGAHRMIPSSLFDANVDLLIDLNHALMSYIEKKGWTREGDMIYHIAS
ncbi:hypothetical protein PG984_005660 [Apiospora sp. TS-2023a]